MIVCLRGTVSCHQLITSSVFVGYLYLLVVSACFWVCFCVCYLGGLSEGRVLRVSVSDGAGWADHSARSHRLQEHPLRVSPLRMLSFFFTRSRQGNRNHHLECSACFFFGLNKKIKCVKSVNLRFIWQFYRDVSHSAVILPNTSLYATFAK